MNDVQAAISHVRANRDHRGGVGDSVGGLRLIGLRLLIQQQRGCAGNEGRTE
jgi:hypothetical protein